jgi:hypothetical protein
MSLLSESYETFILYDLRRIPDGESGFYEEYVEAAEFTAAVVPETNSVAKVAEAISQKLEYRVTTQRNVILQQNDIIKRKSDGQTFRIYYKNNKKTPPSAGLDMRETFAEEWNLPS